ncbi:MAG: hypothetical protein ACK4NC_04290 [Candidatus Gracilibacteria bacterium]
MKLTAKLPINLSILEGSTYKKDIYMDFINRKVLVTTTINFELNKEHTQEAYNVGFFNDDKSLMGQTIFEIDVDLTEEEEKLFETERFNKIGFDAKIFTSVVNELIDLYRYKSKHWWIERIYEDHIKDILVSYKYSNFMTEGGFEGVYSSDPKERDRLKNSISNAYLQNQEIPIFLEYLLLANKYLHYKRYDLVSVNINIALESLIYLISKEVLGDERHEKLVEGELCKCCERRIYPNLNKITSEIDTILHYDHDVNKDLLKKIQRPKDSTLRNDITHGHVVFLSRSLKYEEHANLQYDSFIKLMKIYKIQISEYL